MTDRLLLSGLVVVLGACATRPAGGPPEVLPVIERLEPESGPAGEAYPLRLRIVGGAFDAEGNTVRFGPVTLSDVPSADGTSIEVVVPKTVRSGSEVPPRVLQPGEYEVVVETAAGSSAPRVFVLTRG